MGRLDGIRYQEEGDRKSTRLNSSHLVISYAVFCLKKIVDRSGTFHRSAVRHVYRRARVEPPVEGITDRHEQRNGVLDRLAINLFFFFNQHAAPALAGSSPTILFPD